MGPLLWPRGHMGPATLLGWALCWALTELFLVLLALVAFWPLSTGGLRGFLAAFDAADGEAVGRGAGTLGGVGAERWRPGAGGWGRAGLDGTRLRNRFGDAG